MLEGIELGAVKAAAVGLVVLAVIVPQVVDQPVLAIGALAVNCWVFPSTVVAVGGVRASGPIVTVVLVDNAVVLASVAVTIAWVPVELAVKTHDVVFVAHAFWKLPSPVALQLTGAFAVKVWFSPSATFGFVGVMARGTTEIYAVPLAPEVSVAVAVTVPDPPVVVAAAVKVLVPLKEPRPVGFTEYATGIVEGVELKVCVSPATTLAETGLTSRDIMVIFADPVAPEPSVAVAVSVAVPVEVPAIKTHEVVLLLQVGIVPSPDTDQLADTFELKVNWFPSSTV